MAKRYTNKEQWKQQWYRELGSQGRDIYHYILDNADYVGVWDIDLPLMEFQLGFRVTLDDISKVFKHRIIRFDDKIFFEEYLKTQYSHLSKTDPMYHNITKKLKYHGLSSEHLMLLEHCERRTVAEPQAEAEAKAIAKAEAKAKAEAEAIAKATAEEKAKAEVVTDLQKKFSERFGRR